MFSILLGDRIGIIINFLIYLLYKIIISSVLVKCYWSYKHNIIVGIAITFIDELVSNSLFQKIYISTEI